MDTKKCTNCLKHKPTTEFYKLSGKPHLHNPRCKACLTVLGKSRKQKWEQTKGKEKAAHNRKLNTENLFEYLQSHPCVDCGETDPIVLEFDHVCRETKTNNISRIVSTCKWEKVIAEIEKCVVRCANCHRIKTGLENGWW